MLPVLIQLLYFNQGIFDSDRVITIMWIIIYFLMIWIFFKLYFLLYTIDITL